MTKPTISIKRRRPFRSMTAVVLMALPIHSLVTTTGSRSTRTNNSIPRTGAASALAASPSGSLHKKEEEETFEFVPASGGSKPTTRGTASETSRMAVMEDRHEFELNLGRAVDILKQDYPEILTEAPDFSIYDPHLEVVDPAGVKLHGLKNYKNAFRLVHTIVNVFYCPERSLLTFRLVYDWARNNIRVSWNAEVVPKAIFGGSRTTLHVDGISVYVLSPKTGKIVQHRVEHLMINDNLIAPERGIIHALQKECNDPDCIPVFNADAPASPNVVKFQQTNPLTSLLSKDKSSSLFSSSSAMTASSDSQGDGGMDWEAFERKNQTRKKFGLEPLTPEEFQEIEAQVKQMEVQQQQQRAASAVTAKEEKKENIFNKLLGNLLEDTCESNFDCQRPKVCCDFGFKKMCCTSGMMVGQDGPRFGDKATVPVVESPFPPGLGPDEVPGNYGW